MKSFTVTPRISTSNSCSIAGLPSGGDPNLLLRMRFRSGDQPPRLLFAKTEPPLDVHPTVVRPRPEPVIKVRGLLNLIPGTFDKLFLVCVNQAVIANLAIALLPSLHSGEQP